MTSPLPAGAASSVRVSTAVPAQVTLRRLILYALLFALVVIASIGLSGLLGRLFSSGSVLASADVAGLSRSLAFTLIGGPLAILLWRVVWGRLDDDAERASTALGLYLTAIYAVSLVVSVTALLGMAASFIGQQELQWQTLLSTGLVWAAVWLWHRWMWRHPVRHPLDLEDVPVIVGWVFGLVVAAVAAINALSGLFDVAIRGFASLAPVAEAWWQPVLRALVWAVGGTVVWWWHWFRADGRKQQTDLADVALIGVGIFAAGITALVAAGVGLLVLLRLAFDRSDPISGLLAPLGPAIAALAIGALVWRYHRVSSLRAVDTRRASLLVTSGVALAAAASGIGVVINAALASAVSPLAGSGTRTLLLGGLSSLIVGGPVWWQAWAPTRQPRTAAAIPAGRRIYLIVFFGISAVVSLVALLVIGFRLFEFLLLDDVSQGGLLDRIRAPLGLLVAAGFVSAYHFSLWRRERALLVAAAPKGGSIGQVILVTSSYPESLTKAIAGATGAKVTVWMRTDSGPALSPPEGASPGESELLGRATAALDGVTAGKVLLVIGAGARVEVIPLETRDRHF